MNDGSMFALFVLAILLLAAGVLFGPLLVLWVANTLALNRIEGASPLTYGLFTWEWLAGLVACFLFGAGASSSVRKSKD